MQDVIQGLAYVVGDDVDTDQIIPAEYLVLNPGDPAERKQFGRFALVGVPPAGAGLPTGSIPFVDQADPKNTASRFSVVIGGSNFGCGSSREHAPLALAEAGVRAVVAESYARIFYRNSVNGGYLVPLEAAAKLNDQVRTGDEVEIRISENLLIDKTTGKRFTLQPLGDVLPIVAAGGVFAYAKQTGMLK
ncbi:MAG: 3-isopropylmalate dehydratase [Phycisphaerae bacterium]|nr:3-isopropylmalate dehydratase [Phycisphaerae bacterium]